MTDDLDILRPEVREAVHRTDVTVEMFDTLVTVDRDDYDAIRAELLRLAEDAAMFAHAVSLGQRYKQRAETDEAELADARETIKRLNRRVQVAEAGVADKVKASGGGFGRSLANAAAAMFMRERDEARAELAALKARIAEAPEYRCEADIISGRDGDYISAVLIHDDNAFQYPDVDGKRVRLVVEE